MSSGDDPRSAGVLVGGRDCFCLFKIGVCPARFFSYSGRPLSFGRAGGSFVEYFLRVFGVGIPR